MEYDYEEDYEEESDTWEDWMDAVTDEELPGKYFELLKLVREQNKEVERLQEIQWKDVKEYHDTVDNTIRPVCRVAVCEEIPGIVSYFLVAIFFKNQWCYYTSSNW